jgi:hypothetical protein
MTDGHHGHASGGGDRSRITAEHAAADSGRFRRCSWMSAQRAPIRGNRGRTSRDRRRRRSRATPVSKPKPAIGRRAQRGVQRPVAGKGGPPATGPTDKDREADERLATRVREAVDTATAESTPRIRELEELLAAQRRPTDPRQKADASGARGSKPPTERKGPLTKAEIAAFQAHAGGAEARGQGAPTAAYLYDTRGRSMQIALSHFIQRNAGEPNGRRRAVDQPMLSSA